MEHSGSSGLSCDELTRRAHFQLRVRVAVVLVLDPPGNPFEDRDSIRQGHDVDAVALQRLREHLGYPLPLGSIKGCVAGPQAGLAGRDARVPDGDVT